MPRFNGIVDTRTKLDRLGPPDDSTNLNVSTKRHGLAPKLSGDATEFLNGEGEYATPTGVVPSAHASTHENGGSDEISVAGLSGLLATAQTPAAHATSHQNGGADEINVGGLSGVLADPQTAIAHAILSATHSDAATDAVTRGSLIVGNATPAWDELTIGGAGTVLTSDGTDVSWQTPSGGTVFADNVFRIEDNGDPTKELAFEVSPITTGTTRTVTAQNSSGTMMLLEADQTVTGQITFPDETSSKYPVFSTQDSGTGAGLFAVIHDAVAASDLFLVMTGTPSGNVLEFPVAGGIIVTTAGAQTINSKTFSTTGNVLRCNSSGTGVAFADNSTTTKVMRVVMSGAASGNSSLNIVNSAARAYTLGNDAGTVDMVVAPASATVDKTAQTASIGATTAYTTVHAGFYRISAYWVFTAVTVAGTLAVSVLFTDPQQAQTEVVIAATVFGAAGDNASGNYAFYATSGSTIQFTTTLVNTGTYNVYVRVESLT